MTIVDLPPFMQRQEAAMRRVGLSLLTKSGRWPPPTRWQRFKRWLGL